MKVLHLIPSLEIGGAEKQLATLVAATSSSTESKVCTILKDGHFSDELRSKGVQVTCLHAGPLRLFKAIRTFRRLTYSFQPDILVTHLIHADLIGRVLGRLFGVKIIVCSQRGSLQNWEFLRFFDRLTTRLVSHYLVQTKVSRDALAKRLRLSPARFTVIPNILDSQKLSTVSKERGEVTFKELGIPKDAFIVTCVGNLRPIKGVETLVRAMKLIEDGRSIHVLLVGDGSSRASLESLTKELELTDRIHFLGSRKDALDILAASNLMVLPSLEEGMSNAILEAMALAIPILVSDIPVNQELTASGKYGTLFNVGNEQSLARELEVMYSNQARNGEVAREAQKYVLNLCDSQRVTEQFLSVLTDLTKKEKR